MHPFIERFFKYFETLWDSSNDLARICEYRKYFTQFWRTFESQYFVSKQWALCFSKNRSWALADIFFCAFLVVRANIPNLIMRKVVLISVTVCATRQRLNLVDLHIYDKVAFAVENLCCFRDHLRVFTVNDTESSCFA